MKKILIPIDFSSISACAVEFALKISDNKKMELIFYHLNAHPVFKEVISEKRLYVGVQPDTKCMEKLIVFIKNRLDKKKKKNGRRLKFIVETGSSASGNILAISKKHKVDLVIMGTKGATGLKKIMLGSVASQVIRDSSVPVIVVPVLPKAREKMDLIYSTDLLNTQNEIARIKPLQELLGGNLEVLYINYGWAFIKKEQKEYDALKKSGILFCEKKVPLKNPLGFHLQTFMKKRPNAVLVLFHEKKNFIEKLIFRNRPEKFAMEMKVPMVSFQKK